MVQKHGKISRGCDGELSTLMWDGLVFHRRTTVLASIPAPFLSILFCPRSAGTLDRQGIFHHLLGCESVSKRIRAPNIDNQHQIRLTRRSSCLHNVHPFIPLVRPVDAIHLQSVLKLDHHSPVPSMRERLPRQHSFPSPSLIGRVDTYASNFKSLTHRKQLLIIYLF